MKDVLVRVNEREEWFDSLGIVLGEVYDVKCNGNKREQDMAETIMIKAIYSFHISYVDVGSVNKNYLGSLSKVDLITGKYVLERVVE